MIFEFVINVLRGNSLQMEYGPRLHCAAFGESSFKIIGDGVSEGKAAAFEFITPSRFQRDVVVLTIQARNEQAIMQA